MWNSVFLPCLKKLPTERIDGVFPWLASFYPGILSEMIFYSTASYVQGTWWCYYGRQGIVAFILCVGCMYGVCVHAHMLIHVSAGAGAMFQVWRLVWFLTSWGRVSCLLMYMPDHVRWLLPAMIPPGHRHAGKTLECIHMHARTLCLALCVFWGFKLRTSCLQGEYFTHWAISSAWVSLFFIYLKQFMVISPVRQEFDFSTVRKNIVSFFFLGLLWPIVALEQGRDNCCGDPLVWRVLNS